MTEAEGNFLNGPLDKTGFTRSLRLSLVKTVLVLLSQKSITVQVNTSLVSSERVAQRHAVINHNPFLGRITIDALAVYKTEKLNSLSFYEGWSILFIYSFGQEWDATTISLDNGNARVEAESSEGHELSYTFSGSKGFLERLVWRDGDEPFNFEWI